MFRFLNFHRHPEIKGEWVFYFREKEVADYFDLLLKEENIPHKKLIDEHKPDILYYSFTKEHFDRAQILNSEAMGKFPRPFIPEKSARIFLMVIFILVLTFALTGYIVTQLKK